MLNIRKLCLRQKTKSLIIYDSVILDASVMAVMAVYVVYTLNWAQHSVEIISFARQEPLVFIHVIDSAKWSTTIHIVRTFSLSLTAECRRAFAVRWIHKIMCETQNNETMHEYFAQHFEVKRFVWSVHALLFTNKLTNPIRMLRKCSNWKFH